MKSETNQPFRSEWVSEAVLRRLMQHGLVVRMIRVRNKDQARSDPNTLLYQQGKAYDYFVLILEGRVEVKNETNSQTDQRGFPVEILRVLRLTVGRFFCFFLWLSSRSWWDARICSSRVGPSRTLAARPWPSSTCPPLPSPTSVCSLTWF